MSAIRQCVCQNIHVTSPLQMDQHLGSDLYAENRSAYLVKNNELWQWNRPSSMLSLFVWVRRWAHSWTYSGIWRFVLKYEYDIILRKFGDLRKYEHSVKARLEHGIWAQSIEYGFITSGPDGRNTATNSIIISWLLIKPCWICWRRILTHRRTHPF